MPTTTSGGASNAWEPVAPVAETPAADAAAPVVEVPEPQPEPVAPAAGGVVQAPPGTIVAEDDPPGLVVPTPARQPADAVPATAAPSPVPAKGTAP